MFDKKEFKEIAFTPKMPLTEKAKLIETETKIKIKEDGLNMSDQNETKTEEPSEPEKGKEDEDEQKLSQDDKKKPGLGEIIKSNVSRNRKIILYYLGVFIVNIFVRGSNLLSVVIPDSPVGAFFNGIATDGVLLITFLAPWIFGGREALDKEKKETKRVKEERTGLGVENSDLRVINEGYRIKNELQATLMEQNGMKAYRYTPPPDIGLGSGNVINKS